MKSYSWFLLLCMVYSPPAARPAEEDIEGRDAAVKEQFTFPGQIVMVSLS